MDTGKFPWRKKTEKTAFQTPQGQFQFKKMPFGMVTAPSTFARIMRSLRLEEYSAISLFDDVLVATKTWDGHVEALDKVLDRFVLVEVSLFVQVKWKQNLKRSSFSDTWLEEET